MTLKLKKMIFKLITTNYAKYSLDQRTLQRSSLLSRISQSCGLSSNRVAPAWESSGIYKPLHRVVGWPRPYCFSNLAAQNPTVQHLEAVIRIDSSQDRTVSPSRQNAIGMQILDTCILSNSGLLRCALIFRSEVCPCSSKLHHWVFLQHWWYNEHTSCGVIVPLIRVSIITCTMNGWGGNDRNV